jgi:hypothetical protein
MALPNTHFQIAAALLISGAFLPAANAQQSAMQRAATFGISDIRGMAYHPGPALDECTSTVGSKCTQPSWAVRKLPIDPSFYTESQGWFGLPFFEDSIQTYDPQGTPYYSNPNNKIPLEQKYTIYYDADFYNTDFMWLWGKKDSLWRRDDLGRFKMELNANFIHLYDWNPVDPGQRKHGPFLDYAQQLGMRVTIPISNWTYKIMCGRAEGNWEDRVTQVFNTIYASSSTTPHAAAGVLKIFNEYDGSECRNVTYVAAVAKKWKSLEDSRQVPDEGRLPIIFPVTFAIKNGFAGGAVVDAFKAITDDMSLGLSFWQQRVIYATNPFNDGKFMKNWLEAIPKTLADNGIPDTPVMFTEYGINHQDDTAQANWVRDQFTAVYVPKPKNFLGASAFVNQDRPWLGQSERDYALMTSGWSSWADHQKAPTPTIVRMVKYQNPNDKQGQLWLAYYEVALQKPRQAYCEVGKIFYGTAKPPLTCP